MIPPSTTPDLFPPHLGGGTSREMAGSWKGGSSRSPEPPLPLKWRPFSAGLSPEKEETERRGSDTHPAAAAGTAELDTLFNDLRTQLDMVSDTFGTTQVTLLTILYNDD